VQHNSSWPVRLVRDAGGDQSVAFARGQRLEIPRASVPSLANISGPTAAVTVVAVVRPLLGGFVGGVWDEADAARQYALYLGPMARCSVAGGVVGHISAEGGGSPNQSYCESAACGSTSLLARAGWTCAASTYDGLSIRAYVNGTLDNHGDNHYNGTALNPFAYPNPPTFPNGGIFTPQPGHPAADFALGSNYVRHPPGSGIKKLTRVGFSGEIKGFAVWRTALSAAQLAAVCAQMRMSE
jgi:hypothetical protein